MQCGVHQERQQDQGGEQIGQVVLAVTEVVVEMITLSLESVVVVVLDFPSGPSSRDEAVDVVVGDGMGRGPGIVEEDVASGMGGDELAPVGQDGASLSRKGT